MVNEEDPDYFKTCLKAHGYKFSDEESSDGKSESDEELRSVKPPPVPYDQFKHKIIKINQFNRAATGEAACKKVTEPNVDDYNQQLMSSLNVPKPIKSKKKKKKSKNKSGLSSNNNVALTNPVLNHDDISSKLSNSTHSPNNIQIIGDPIRQNLVMPLNPHYLAYNSRPTPIALVPNLQMVIPKQENSWLVNVHPNTPQYPHPEAMQQYLQYNKSPILTHYSPMVIPKPENSWPFSLYPSNHASAITRQHYIDFRKGQPLTMAPMNSQIPMNIEEIKSNAITQKTIVKQSGSEKINEINFVANSNEISVNPFDKSQLVKIKHDVSGTLWEPTGSNAITQKIIPNNRESAMNPFTKLNLAEPKQKVGETLCVPSNTITPKSLPEQSVRDKTKEINLIPHNSQSPGNPFTKLNSAEPEPNVCETLWKPNGSNTITPKIIPKQSACEKTSQNNFMPNNSQAKMDFLPKSKLAVPRDISEIVRELNLLSKANRDSITTKPNLQDGQAENKFSGWSTFHTSQSIPAVHTTSRNETDIRNEDLLYLKRNQPKAVPLSSNEVPAVNEHNRQERVSCGRYIPQHTPECMNYKLNTGGYSKQERRNNVVLIVNEPTGIERSTTNRTTTNTLLHDDALTSITRQARLVDETTAFETNFKRFEEKLFHIRSMQHKCVIC